jgi:XTP/dITP diphosphohydrolase
MASTLFVATTNAGKLREILDMLADVPLTLETLGDRPRLQALAPPEETGATLAENARLKALYYGAASGIPTVAEDSGLEIDALGGAPGIHSARFGGVDSTYPQKFALLYRQLQDALGRPVAQAPEAQLAARFVCAVALVDKGVVQFETRGTVEGVIAPEARGSGGFGYDPIFFYPPFGCTLAEAGPRKAEVSHRAKAFGRLRLHLLKIGD